MIICPYRAILSLILVIIPFFLLYTTPCTWLSVEERVKSVKRLFVTNLNGSILSTNGSLWYDLLMKYPCVESTVDLVIEGFLIRLWINENEVKEEYSDNKETCQQLVSFVSRRVRSSQEIIEYVFKQIPRINAAQVKKGGHGLVVYFVDFSSDVHG